MAYVIRTLDDENAKEVRARYREAHWDYLYANEDHILISGPLLDADGSIVGGLIVIDLPTEEDAQRFAREDPFTQAGLFKLVEVSGFRRGFPRALSDYPDPRAARAGGS